MHFRRHFLHIHTLKRAHTEILRDVHSHIWDGNVFCYCRFFRYCICKGGDEEVYQPFSAIFGFRYVKVEGYDENINPGDFTAIAVYSAMEETGKFACSNTVINKLVSNARWSQKGNFMDVPVDCPTRERNAWTGDAQVFVRTACTFMNAYAFYCQCNSLPATHRRASALPSSEAASPWTHRSAPRNCRRH